MKRDRREPKKKPKENRSGTSKGVPITQNPRAANTFTQSPEVSGNPKAADLARFKEEGAGQVLTTNQGIRVNDDQNSLKAGPRGPSLLEDFHFREKITHFDHERIPERVVHARGAGAHGYFQVYEITVALHEGRVPPGPARADAGVRPLLDGGGLARLDRPGARRPRLRRQVLHRGRRLRPRREQHPGLLHPGRASSSRTSSTR